MKTIAFFNDRAGVGKTTLVYHLAWMLAELGLSVLAADLDPQANLSSLFLDEDLLEEIWTEPRTPRTVLGSLLPLLEGTGEVATPWIAQVASGIGLVVGDLALSARVEDGLSACWLNGLEREPNALRVFTAFWRLLALAAAERQADVVLLDVASNLGALNRAVLSSASQVVIPLVPDLYSIQGLTHLGATLRGWQESWRERLASTPESSRTAPVPGGAMEPVGYVMLQHPVRLDRPVMAYKRWLDQVPAIYARAVLNQAPEPPAATPNDDPNCLAQLRYNRILMPLAREARKPMFHLTPADGALGGHLQAAVACRKEFRALARELAGRCGLLLP
ncbi:MAG: ParA family protein [Cyanobacteria bacterium K_Offshore_surface_m2_239]|nr:ParA family protein [Cyanobacteria bacterium K_Offshore_surface_m2_239]